MRNKCCKIGTFLQVYWLVQQFLCGEKYCSIEGKISHAVSVTQKPIELQGYVYAGKKKQIIMKQFWYSIIFNHLYHLSPSTPLWLLPQNGNFDVSNMK